MSVANRPSNRPLSPHLQVYRLPLTANLSILHRATGVALAVGALYLATWVIYAASGPRGYAVFQSFNSSILGRIVLGGWLFSLFFHLCNGIRHLFWDAGYGFELKDASRNSWIVVIVALVATAVSWIVGLRLV
ncbi:MAG: succinate dehydrogenase, cytochrome b556 subunit [Proteobacteria bacterium]|nr:succinate dehydrogenase, cytochrome b556 subunit [Pseudomonadota bacterium]